MPYSLQRTHSPSGSTYFVADATCDASTLDIALIGRAYPNYGEKLQENLLHIMENFSSDVPPLNPIDGQLWFDNQTNTLNVRTTLDTWKSVFSTLDGSVTNDHVADDADIELAKLEPSASVAQIMISNASNIGAWRTMVGDGTIDEDGIFALESNIITTEHLTSAINVMASNVEVIDLTVTNTMLIQSTNPIIQLNNLNGSSVGSDIALGVTGDDFHLFAPDTLSGTQVPGALGGGRSIIHYNAINEHVNLDAKTTTTSDTNSFNAHDVNAENLAFTKSVQHIHSAKSGNSDYNLVAMTAVNDTKFLFRGDGNAFADGAFTGGGADIGELFEWYDGNPNNEDRIGETVALFNDKIVLVEHTSDDIIGIISGTANVIGNTAWNNWHAKYLKDDFNRPITEEYTVVEWSREIDGVPHTFQYVEDDMPTTILVPSDATRTISRRKKLNPVFVSTNPYTPRIERPEWDVVGINGIIRVKVSAIKSTKWHFLRTINNEVEEWLVL